MNGWTDGSMHGWMDGWMDGRMGSWAARFADQRRPRDLALNFKTTQQTPQSAPRTDSLPPTHPSPHHPLRPEVRKSCEPLGRSAPIGQRILASATAAPYVYQYNYSFIHISMYINSYIDIYTCLYSFILLITQNLIFIDYMPMY